MPTILRAARLLLDRSAEIIQDGVVIIDNGLITHAGPWGQIVNSIAISHEVRDLGDVTLMPGLFDCHVRLLQLNNSRLHIYVKSRYILQWIHPM